MNYEELMSIKVIPKDIAKSLVNNLYHTPYKDEIRLFSCIKQGNLKKLIFEMTQLGIQSITVGQMSDDELKQQKYMAVSFITLATRYAIQGGMNEHTASRWNLLSCEIWFKRCHTCINKKQTVVIVRHQ